jgi:hypothetical protein
MNYVPYTRPVKRGDTGKDCKAIKRALHKAGVGPATKDNQRFLDLAVRALRNFQKHHGLKMDGVYGPLTHKRLAPYFDAYGAWLMGQARKMTGPEQKRSVIVATAMLGYRQRSLIHYTQGPARMQGVRDKIRPPAVPHYEDCSSFATWLYWVAGAPDPNGRGFDGYGFTGTMIQNGHLVGLAQLEPGDLVFYGTRAVPSHVATYVGGGKVVSHGSEAGPLLVDRRYRSDVHSMRSYL